ncbi:MAG: hypothetical protein RLY78_1507 [Pseudomonadota bacterium]|jgi:sodium/bile acid cotransporter 7
MTRPAYLPDNFVLTLTGCVILALLLPIRGAPAEWLHTATNLGVAWLFFLHGAKLSRQAVVEGLLHWRLHLSVLATTYGVFPLLGLAMWPLLQPWIGPTLMIGVLFVCALPSTVQSSIAFTSLARGNVAAAVCSASISNVAGIVLTPLLMAALVSGLGLGATGQGQGLSWSSVQGIVSLLLAPFVAGQIAQPWLGGWVRRHAAILKPLDQGIILAVVYGAFSEAMVQGLYQQLGWGVLAILLAWSAVLLALVMGLLVWGSRRLGFERADEIAIVFCGSKKTLASGVPMAQILFAGQPVGLLVLPIMVFHQLQLMVCAVLAQRYARQAETAATDA